MADGMQTNGADVQQAVTAALEAQKKQKKKKRLIILGIVVALIVVIGVAAGSGGNDAETASGDGSTASQTVAENTKGKDGKLGSYVCTVKSATMCKNWEGKDSVKIVYNFTNNASDSMSFDTALEDKVYQDGIALEKTFNSDDSDGEQVWDVAIKPGITKEVAKLYVLRNTTSDLEIEVGEWLSFDDTKYTTTIKF